MSANEPRVEAGAPGFDERLERLEAIVAELENGGIALEPAIDRYQEGVELLKDCRAILAGYRKRVEELSNGAEPVLRPYDADPDAGCESAG
jgi:exodeoxyribonuclease VII small subunit